MTNQIDQNRAFSEQAICKLQKNFKSSHAFNNFGNLTCYAVGSIGRLEADNQSDIDAFFVHYDKGKEGKPANKNLKKIKLFSDFIKIVEDLEFEEISNDGQFLEVLSLSKMEKEFGAPSDDFENHFTARMLLILESKCLFGDDYYDKVLDEILDTYFLDYNEHPDNFKPTILLNDIIRYWKTLCLNYENKRPRSRGEETSKQKIKRLKLKYSRLLTCFGTVISICASSSINKESLKSMCKETPLNRIRKIIPEECKTLNDNFVQISNYYGEFLAKANSFEAITQSEREKLFSNAENFAATLNEILQETCIDKKMHRELLL